MEEYQFVENSTNFFNYFIAGGIGPMSLLSILLIFLLFAAWKAPNWVREIGKIALVFGLMMPLFPIYRCIETLAIVAANQGNGVTGIFDLISPVILFGVRYTMIPAIYGMLICIISLIIRIIIKPRL